MAKTATVTEEIVMYNGEVKVVFYPNSHRYKVNGESVKSVTGVLSIINKPFLIQWAVNLAKGYLLSLLTEKRTITDRDVHDACSLYDQVRTDATDVGHMIHEWCERFVKNKMAGVSEILDIPDNEQAQNGIQGFLGWYNAHKVEFLASEKMVYSRKNNYVGTYDTGFVLDGKKILGDFKSSKAIYAEAILQMIAYVMAHEEEHGETYDGVMVLRFDKETGAFDTFQLMKTDALYQACEQAFLGAVHLQKTHSTAEKLLKDREKEE